MVFSSLEFIFIFLPIFLIVYFLAPPNFKNLTLFVGSLLFYAAGTLDHPFYILLIAASVLVNFLIANTLESRKKGRKGWFLLGIFYNFGWLFLFKYADFLFSGINTLFDTLLPQPPFRLPEVHLLLPAGISFYTFQAVSYLCDVYWEKCRAEKSFVKFGTYICMFPQLIAGPIVTYTSVKESLYHRSCSMENLVHGIQLFIIGLGSKVLLANRIGALWTNLSTIGYDSISTPLAWMGLAAFTFQIYFDFLGYSLMAVGLGNMIGFQLPRNFNEPYRSLSMTEFWRRWHITLGAWFRDYIYIPLGGSRNGMIRTIFNLLIVWLFTGLWHGAGLNFLLWGFVLFLLIAIEKLGLKNILDRYPVIGHLYMTACIPLTWMLFAITDLKQLGIFIGRLFHRKPLDGAVIFQHDYLKYGKEYGILLVVCILFCTGIPRILYSKIKDSPAEVIFLLAVFWASFYCLYIGLNDPFLYFRF